jgi:PAS domain S-box-containing protein
VAQASAGTPGPAGDIYRSLFEEMLEGFALHEIICDDAGTPVDYRFLEANPAFESLTGLKRADIIGRTVLEVLPDTEPEWIELYGRVALTGEPARFRMRAGALARTYDVHASSPEPGKFATLFVDATDQDRVTNAIERDERLYRAVVETATDGFWLMDRKGVILGVNDALCEITGYDRQEVVGRTMRDLDVTATPVEIGERMAAVERDGSAVFETTLLAKDGTSLPVEVNASFWPIEGGRFFAFFRDLTKRRRAEYILRARAELLDLEKDSALDDILRLALDKAELLTGSSIGFFHLVDPDQEHLTLQMWSTNTLATMCDADGKGQHYAASDAGVWTEPLRTRQPAIHNDYAQMPGRKGMPVGHALVTRELVVPVMRGGMVIALMGVGNKATDYVPEDVVPVDAIANMAANIALHGRAQEEYERFFDLIPDLVLIVSADGRFRRFNARWEDVLGYTPAEMMSRPFMDFVHPDDRMATQIVFADEMEGIGVTGFENRYMAKDGTYRWLEWSATPIMSEGMIFGVARDITASKEADEALRHSEERYRDLFENLTEGYAYCRMVYQDGDPVDWVYIAVNQAFEELTGIAGATGRPVSELIPGIRDSDPELFATYARVASAGEPERFEMEIAALDMWFDVQVHSPEPGHFVALFDNITRRKRIEIESAEREQRLQALLDNAPYGAHMYELMPDDRLVFIGYNARAVEMLGIDHEALLGTTLEEAFPGNVATETPDAYRCVAREGGTWSVDQYTYEAGEIGGVFEVFAFSFGPNRVSVFFRDVTELRRAELDLQRSEANLRGTVAKLATAIRTLKALSACNEALVRAENEQWLLQRICDISVEQGGYMMSWVGFAERDEAHTVRPVAHAGSEQGYLEAIKITWNDAPTAHGPAGTTINTGRPMVINDIESDPRFVPWKSEALSRGYGSVAAFPLTLSDGETIGAILFYRGEQAEFQDEELDLLSEFSVDLSYGIETLRTRVARNEASGQLVRSNERLKGLLREVTVALGRVVEARDPYTSGHEERVSRLASQIAIEMGLSREEAEGVEIAGLVHDIGKLSVPAEILTKPSSLSPIELRLVREHSMSGYDILKGISFAWPVADIVLQHHERIDGSGYPSGIRGADMLPLARILAVADVVEAMASHRPYRPALGLDAAIAEISSHPELYDPEAAAACVRLHAAGAIDM